MADTSASAVLVVDGDAAWRSRITSMLEQVGLDVHAVATAGDALAEAQRRLPQAVVLEVSLPDFSGYEVCKELRDTFGDSLPIIFASGVRTESFDRVAGLLVGADDYLVKPFAPDELVARLRALLRRTSGRQTTSEGDRPLLTRREFEVLGLLVEGLEQPEIAERLVISPKTVGNHIDRILKKLGVHNRAQAVAAAYRQRIFTA